ncbi:MAG: endonuclease/exonuclease/phosphatase family protein [Pseudomonadota bacterium]
MQQEIRFATFNTLNLAPCGARLYDQIAPSSAAEYEAKLDWTARQLDALDADVVGLQEVFAPATLQAVLARTTHYRQAQLLGIEPDPSAERLKPNVALVSRLPLAGAATIHTHFPAGVALPHDAPDAGRFARAALHAPLQMPNGSIVDVLVVHLKSQRPDYRNGDNAEDSALFAQACLRSLLRRGTEAVALRVLLCELGRRHARARVVLGDFNDVAEAVSTGIVLGAGAPLRERMYDAYQVQAQQDRLRHVAFSSLHEGRYSTIDHILVSPHFHGALPDAIGEVAEVHYLNDHLALAPAQSSDHGQVMARIVLRAP